MANASPETTTTPDAALARGIEARAAQEQSESQTMVAAELGHGF
jgi:hypothetical protein